MGSRADGGPPGYDPSKPPGRGQQAPLKPEYAAIHEASLKDQADCGQGNDVGYWCIPSGMPRQMSGIQPFEIVFTPDRIFILFELMTQETRRIYTDGRAWPDDSPLTYATGDQNYYISGDGYLMPARKGQQPADLRYFKAPEKRSQN